MPIKILLAVTMLSFAVVAGYGLYSTDSAEVTLILSHFPASILSYSLLPPPTAVILGN